MSKLADELREYIKEFSLTSDPMDMYKDFRYKGEQEADWWYFTVEDFTDPKVDFTKEAIDNLVVISTHSAKYSCAILPYKYHELSTEEICDILFPNMKNIVTYRN